MTDIVIHTQEKSPVANFNPVIISRNGCIKYIKIAKCACRAIALAVVGPNVTAVSPHDKKNPFIFSFVRHPLTRFVSGYTDKVLTNKIKTLIPGTRISPKTTVGEFVDFLMSFSDPRKIEGHFRPQSYSLDDRKHLQPSFIGRLENIEEDWKILMEHGLPPIRHYEDHKSNSPPWQQLLSKDDEDKLRKLFQVDFERWQDFDE